MKWFQWDPAGFPPGTTLGQMVSGMPQSPIMKVPSVITFLENPKSPFYLSGPAEINIHDLIHCVLLRGLRSQDEAFVIGFTMGAAKGSSAIDRLLFKNISGSLYPKPFDFSDDDMNVYDVGFDLGLRNQDRSVHSLDPKVIDKMSWSEAVLAFGLRTLDLRDAFQKELSLNIESKASQRIAKTMTLLPQSVL